MFIYFVVVFAASINSGNPTAVVILDKWPKVDYMQKMSLKFNLSQTVFVKKIDYIRHYIRWFTPYSEAPFCIHASLASAYVIFYRNLKLLVVNFYNTNTIITVEKYGQLLNLFSNKIKISNFKDKNSILRIFNNNNECNYIAKSRNILFIELKKENKLYQVKPKFKLINKLPFRALLITSLSRKHDFVSRYFAPIVGIYEDPVCGSAHCRLASYWSTKLGLFRHR